MVIAHGFEFQIVSADEKLPFQEHRKGDKTYVEVEPDAEYFLRVRQTKPGTCKCRYAVDGKNLGYENLTYAGAPERFDGLFTRSNGIVCRKALKFVKASFATSDKAIGSSMAGMGKIELYVYEGIYVGYRKPKEGNGATLTTQTIETDPNAFVTMKKSLRSGEGQTVHTETYDRNRYLHHYESGDLLHKITLHYCATPGLIAVGVLPKPPLWEYQRMLKPAQTTTEEKERLNNAVRSVKRNRKGNEILELFDDDDDSDECDSDNDEDTEGAVVGITPDPILSESKRGGGGGGDNGDDNDDDDNNNRINKGTARADAKVVTPSSTRPESKKPKIESSNRQFEV